DGTAALKDGGYTCFYLLPSRNPFPQRPWAARRRARSMRASGSCVAQPFCFSGKAGDFGAIHPQTISGGQGAEEKPQPLLRAAKAGLQVSFQALALKAQGWTTLIMRQCCHSEDCICPRNLLLLLPDALTESVSSDAVGGAAECVRCAPAEAV